MTSIDDEAQEKTTFWKGLAVFLGIVLLLAVVSWSRDRHALKSGQEQTRAQVEEREAEIERLATAARAGEEQARDLGEALAGREADLAALEAELAEERSRHEAASEQAQLLRSELGGTAALLQQREGVARARIARLEEHCAALQQREKDRIAEAAALEERLAATTGVVRGAEDERARWRLERNDLQAKIGALETELESRRADLEASRARFEKMEAQSAKLREVTREAEARVLVLMHEHESLLVRLKASAVKATATPTTVVAKPALGDDLAELRILRARDETRAREIERLRKEVAALKAALDRARP